MSMRWIDLSHEIRGGMDQYPGDQRPVRLIRDCEHGVDPYLATSLEIGCHVGTHLDAPLHFGPGRPGVDALPLSACAGPARVLDVRAVAAAGPLPANLLPAAWCPDVDFLLLHTGWSRHWRTPQYYDGWPWLAADLADRLAAAGLKGVGIDGPSVDDLDRRACHDIFAAAGMVNLENLTGLAALPPEPFLLVALPLKLHATEASPVRAAALIGDLPLGRQARP
jgi:arylformamidase